MTPDEFVARWENTTLTERAAAQSHFIDLCRLLQVPTPIEADPQGKFYTFEKQTDKDTGHRGFADVWYKEHFAWEYKKPQRDLDAALAQLRQYAGALGNPPLLVVSDMRRIRVITQFTNYVTRTREIAIADLRDPKIRDWLRNLWENPLAFRPDQTREQATEAAAKQFSLIADSLRSRGAAGTGPSGPHTIAHFLIRTLFCLFAENIGLLPPRHFTTMLEKWRGTPFGANRRIKTIFGLMATGGLDGDAEIRYFNGDLFANADQEMIDLNASELDLLYYATAYDWSSVAPAIFGTLFERSLDPAKRSQIGAHYTGERDIMDVVEPVVMAPLRRQWEATRAELDRLAERNRLATPRAQRLLSEMFKAIQSTTVLDPACGSGNFLYVTLKLLHDLEFEVITWQVQHGGQLTVPLVSPDQLFGMDINPYAAELAQAVIWIGHLQWMLDHGRPAGDPVLQKLNNIACRDSLLDLTDPQHPHETPWPAATCIVSNPPFLGGNKVRAELGDTYVETLWRLFDGRVGAFADLVCYFVEHARAQLVARQVERVGMITTNSIRGGANRQVIDRIKASAMATQPLPEHCDLFMAWADRPWILEGAAVRISIIGFAHSDDIVQRTLDGKKVASINADLTSAIDLTKARRLTENAEIGYMGTKKDAPFDIDPATAQLMLAAKGNPNGRPNSDVVKPWINGSDIVRRPRGMWIIDFGVDMPLEQAALYEMPFEYAKKHVQPIRANNNRARYRELWWLHAEARPGMRRALASLKRYIVTPTVAKHRIFAWANISTLPDHQLIAFARDDDYTFGVLHSHAHEIWSLRMGTWLGVGNDPRYTPTTCFETFPFPRPTEARREAVAAAARELVRLRDAWLNPPDATEAELKQRTLTALYNARPQWLVNAHAALDRAVYAAYGWPDDIADDDILEQLLAENLRRAGVAAVAAPDPDETESGSEPDGPVPDDDDGEEE